MRPDAENTLSQEDYKPVRTRRVIFPQFTERKVYSKQHLDLAFQSELNNNAVVSKELRQEFANCGLLLSQTATISVEKKDSRWFVNDRGGEQTYQIIKEKDRLHISKLNIIQRIKAEITVELAQTRMSLEEVLQLAPVTEGVDLNDPDMTEAERRRYIVKLNKQVGEPVDLFINGKVFAKGEVISTRVGDRYGVRIISILTDAERQRQQTRHQGR